MKSSKLRTVLMISIAAIPAALASKAVVSSGVLWVAPENIESRNLFYGRGGKAHEPPKAAFQFVKEDKDGTSPKFLVTDVNGVKWKVKLGLEARPEVAASRLVWAAGYFTDEDYFAEELRVTGLPREIDRGKRWISDGGVMHNARLERVIEEQKKVDTWKWRKSPFMGTREFNGLRVLMALLNNWDLKTSNTAIYEDRDGRRHYAVTDLGGTLGAAGVTFSRAEMRGNLEEYERSKFIRSSTSEFVNLAAPAMPKVSGLLAPANYVERIHMLWIGKHIPREDARWMGNLLGRLSAVQIRDAFRAAQYQPDEVEGFARVVEQRIKELKAL